MIWEGEGKREGAVRLSGADSFFTPLQRRARHLRGKTSWCVGSKQQGKQPHLVHKHNVVGLCHSQLCRVRGPGQASDKVLPLPCYGCLCGELVLALLPILVIQGNHPVRCCHRQAGGGWTPAYCCHLQGTLRRWVKCTHVTYLHRTRQRAKEIKSEPTVAPIFLSRYPDLIPETPPL